MRDLNPVQVAAAVAGSQSKLARALNVRPQSVHQWCETGVVPAKRAIQIERAVNGAVTRYELRPDLYPPEEACAA